jgi:2OG-Fe(II) oxygenase superfamily
LAYYQHHAQVFPPAYLRRLQRQISACPYFATNNLNRDFVGTKGFSVVFQLSQLAQVIEQFAWFEPYLARVMQPGCNAFYLNPLLLQGGSRVDPHIDRSLRAYCKTIEPPAVVSVLYIQVPEDLEGGALVLRSHQRQVGRIAPQPNQLVLFQGDLTHSVEPVVSSGQRLSLVCEQYCLEPNQLEDIPGFLIESRALPRKAARAKGKGDR